MLVKYVSIDDIPQAFVFLRLTTYGLKGTLIAQPLSTNSAIAVSTKS